MSPDSTTGRWDPSWPFQTYISAYRIIFFVHASSSPPATQCPRWVLPPSSSQHSFCTYFGFETRPGSGAQGRALSARLASVLMFLPSFLPPLTKKPPTRFWRIYFKMCRIKIKHNVSGVLRTDSAASFLMRMVPFFKKWVQWDSVWSRFFFFLPPRTPSLRQKQHFRVILKSNDRSNDWG